jgi:ankyrin repeat protein
MRLNTKNIDGDTPLFFAVLKGNLEVVKILVEYGACINIQNNNGDTPLMYAVSKGFEAVAKYLVDAGADVNIQNEKGDNALILAFNAGSKSNLKSVYDSIITLLIESGTELSMVNKNECSPLTYAILYNNIDILKMILRKSEEAEEGIL